MNFINQIFSAALQLGLFASVPFLWYVIRHRKCSGFFRWIGLRRPPVFDRSLLGFGAFTIAAFLAVSTGILYSLKGVDTAASRFAGMGMAGLPSALVYAFISTALSGDIVPGLLAEASVRLVRFPDWKYGAEHPFRIAAWSNVLFADRHCKSGADRSLHGPDCMVHGLCG